MLPVGYTAGRFPLIVQVHGGPESNHTNGWLSRYANPGQAFCARGYGVLFTNYRGSTGRGLEFAGSAFGDPAGAEFDDIVDGVDYLIAEGLVDKNRVGVMGGSYGGYATYWLTHLPHRPFRGRRGHGRGQRPGLETLPDRHPLRGPVRPHGQARPRVVGPDARTQPRPLRRQEPHARC